MLRSPAREKELEEALVRLQAEFENYKKRAARENEQAGEKATAESALKILPVFDDFDIALAYMGKSPHKEFAHGMELIYAKLRDVLKKEGVEEMKCLGESFDPYKHDALRTADGEEGKIIEVVQKGYLFRGKVLRHAKVAVGNGRTGETAAGEKAAEPHRHVKGEGKTGDGGEHDADAGNGECNEARKGEREEERGCD